MAAADIRRLPTLAEREAAWAHKRTVAEWYRDDPAKHAEMDPDMQPMLALNYSAPVDQNELAHDRYHAERGWLQHGWR